MCAKSRSNIPSISGQKTGSHLGDRRFIATVKTGFFCRTKIRATLILTNKNKSKQEIIMKPLVIVPGLIAASLGANMAIAKETGQKNFQFFESVLLTMVIFTNIFFFIPKNTFARNKRDAHPPPQTPAQQ